MLLKRSLVILCCFFSSTAFAERWFEAEVLIFKQRPAPYLQEDFSLKHDAITDKNTLDLLSPVYKSQAMDACINGDPRFQTRTFADTLINSNPQSAVCNDSIDYVKSYDILPVIPQAPAQDTMEQTYLLAPEQLQFNSQRQALNRKGLAPLLHTGWRFKGVSKSRSPSIHLFAGSQLKSNMNSAISYANPDFARLINPPEPLFDQVQAPLTHWELDGLFKIHLRHYLYINANFDITEKQDNGELESARFSQFRRVFSEDIHYFDHPRMGMIVQIRKFNH